MVLNHNAISILKENLGGNTEKKIIYSAVILDKKGRNVLASHVADQIPEGWKPIMHHMTIGFRKSLEDLELGEFEGKTVELTVKSLGKSEMAMAAHVEGFKSINDIPHVTIAVNSKKGGKPVMSNKITDWKKIKPFIITGIVKNIYQ